MKADILLQCARLRHQADKPTQPSHRAYFVRESVPGPRYSGLLLADKS